MHAKISFVLLCSAIYEISRAVSKIEDRVMQSIKSKKIRTPGKKEASSHASRNKKKRENPEFQKWIPSYFFLHTWWSTFDFLIHYVAKTILILP